MKFFGAKIVNDPELDTHDLHNDTVEEVEEEDPIPPYGDKIGRLTRFGGTWLALDDIQALEWDEDDEEFTMRFVGMGEDSWSVSGDDARALQEFLNKKGVV